MGAIFISYRREDVEGQAGRLFQDLGAHFGKRSLFMDVTGIDPGLDFRRVIEQQLASCDVLLAVVGNNWLTVKNDAGQRRLDDPVDFVRLEIASALRRDIRVIPVLVRGARMPREDELPDELKPLAYRNSVELTHLRWDSDVQILIRALDPEGKRGHGSGRRKLWLATAGAVMIAMAGGYGAFAWWSGKADDAPPAGSGEIPQKTQPAGPGNVLVAEAAPSKPDTTGKVTGEKPVAPRPPAAKAVDGSQNAAAKEAAASEAAAANAAAKEAAEKEAAAKEAAAKEAAARQAAARKAAAKEAAAKEAAAKEAAAKEVVAREAAAKEAAAREAEAKEAAVREAAAKEAAAREASAKEAAAREAAARAAAATAVTRKPETAVPRILSQGRLTVRGTWSADLDVGAESQNGADFWWNQVTDVKRNLVPKNGAQFFVLGIRPFDGVSYADLQRLPLSAAPIEGSAATYNRIPQGTVVAYRTSNGRLGKFLVEQYGYNLSIRWATFANVGE